MKDPSTHTVAWSNAAEIHDRLYQRKNTCSMRSMRGTADSQRIGRDRVGGSTVQLERHETSRQERGPCCPGSAFRAKGMSNLGGTGVRKKKDIRRKIVQLQKALPPDRREEVDSDIFRSPPSAKRNARVRPSSKGLQRHGVKKEDRSKNTRRKDL